MLKIKIIKIKKSKYIYNIIIIDIKKLYSRNKIKIGYIIKNKKYIIFNKKYNTIIINNKLSKGMIKLIKLILNKNNNKIKCLII